MVQHIEKLPEKARLKTFIWVKKRRFTCQNHSTFTQHNCVFVLVFFKVQNPQAGGLRASAVPSPYFGQLWGRQTYEKLVAEGSPFAEPLVENQGGGLELSASPQGAALQGSAQRKAPCTLAHLPCLALLACLGSGHCGTPPLPCPHTFRSCPLLGTASFGRTHLPSEENIF